MGEENKLTLDKKNEPLWKFADIPHGCTYEKKFQDAEKRLNLIAKKIHKQLASKLGDNRSRQNSTVRFLEEMLDITNKEYKINGD